VDFGISVALLEKETEIYRAPRAIHLDDETIRIFQAVGVLDDLRDSIIPFDSMQFLDKNGKVLLETSMLSEDQPYGHAPANWFFQPSLEEKLRAHLFQKQNIYWFEGYDVVGVSDHESYVHLEARSTSSLEEINIKSQYVIGCDGGKSQMRKWMNVAYEDLKFNQSWMVVDTFLNNEKDKTLLPSVHQQICDPKRPTTYVPGVGAHRRFEFMLVGEDTKESISDEISIRTLIGQYIDPDKLEIARSAVYTFHGLTAENWRKGRLFLAGDAAHQMPPFAGQGMCSGIRDAHNLAFKLDMVIIKGGKGELLDSYEAERKPHVIAMSKGAIQIGKAIQTQDRTRSFFRNLQFALARNSEFIREQLRRNSIRKISYKRGLLGSNHKLSGQLSIQPTIVKEGDGEILLDEILGRDFIFLSVVNVPNDTKARFDSITGGRALQVGRSFQSQKLKNWMQSNRVDFLIIRPDRYIYDAGKVKDIGRVLESLKNMIKRK